LQLLVDRLEQCRLLSLGESEAVLLVGRVLLDDLVSLGLGVLDVDRKILQDRVDVACL
jgi:hypothetical protein